MQFFPRVSLRDSVLKVWVASSAGILVRLELLRPHMWDLTVELHGVDVDSYEPEWRRRLFQGRVADQSSATLRKAVFDKAVEEVEDIMEEADRRLSVRLTKMKATRRHLKKRGPLEAPTDPSPRSI